MIQIILIVIGSFIAITLIFYFVTFMLKDLFEEFKTVAAAIEYHRRQREEEKMTRIIERVKKELGFR